jgi:type VI secretion system protein ImpM
MQCGVYGKYPAKRDFIVHNLHRPFLSFWENWLASAVAASRERLGSAWQEAFLTAPVWRFWLGHAVCGVTTAGAIMPSVDGIGRYFPLTICACAPEGMRIDPPPFDPMEEWYGKVEQALLRTLGEEFKGEPPEIAAALDFPKLETAGGSNAASIPSSANPVVTVAEKNLAESFRMCLARDIGELYDRRTYWWTQGGRDRPPQIATWDAMPNPYVYSGFLTGRFGEGAGT